MRRLGTFVLLRRRLVLWVWLIVLIAGAASSGAAAKRLTLDFSVPGKQATVAAEKVAARFGSGGTTTPYLLAFTAPAGTAVAGHEREIAAAFARATTLIPGSRVVDEATSHDPAFRTRDGRTAFALLFYPAPKGAADLFPPARVVTGIRRLAPPGWAASATGLDALAAAGTDRGGASVVTEVFVGAAGATVVLAWVFASALALLPLLVAAASVLLSFLLLLPITYATDVALVVQFLIALIGLGLAIDYSLLLVTRWREERGSGLDNHQAVLSAMGTAGRSVAVSGLTVAFGLVSLVALPLPIMRSIGIGGALIPLASVVATLTLTPAVLATIGPRLDRPKVRRRSEASARWQAWAAGVVRRRWWALAVPAAVLGALASAAPGIQVGLSGSSSLASQGPAVDAVRALERGGVATGFLTPVEVLAPVAQAKAVGRDLASVPGVDHVIVSDDAANARGGQTVILAIPHEETTNWDSTSPVRRIREAARANPAILGVSGVGAFQLDFVHAVYGHFPAVLGLVAVLTFLLLARGLRSVVLPLKAVALNLLTVAATMGFLVLLWQQGHGSQSLFGVDATGAITFWVPLLVFAFLFGLSMDYEVFILARMREAKDRGSSTDAAVIAGIARTGRLVTSAALILLLAFVALAAGPGTDLKILATALGFGIFVDATLVRMLMLPALVSVLGDRNWWLPARLARALRVTQDPARAAEERPAQPVASSGVSG